MKPSHHHNRWVICLHPKPHAHLRLFCFPYAGGAASIYYRWVPELPPDIEVCHIQPPGRESRIGEPPFTRLESLLAALEPAIVPYLDKPFAFFGHSLGALMSFELARCLRRLNSLAPIQLFVSGSRAPQIAPRKAPIHALPDGEFLAKLRELNGISETVLQNKELMQLFAPTLRADFAVDETYAYVAEEPLNCPISAFGGLQDSEVTQDEVGAWREQTRGTFTLRMLPGDHFFLQNARSQLLQALSQELQAHQLSRVRRT